MNPRDRTILQVVQARLSKYVQKRFQVPEHHALRAMHLCVAYCGDGQIPSEDMIRWAVDMTREREQPVGEIH
jgi:hypothetical protein